MEQIKRTRKITIAEVITPEGEPVAEIVRPGTLSAPRMANSARREFRDNTLTVRNIRHISETYVMGANRFFELADRID